VISALLQILPQSRLAKRPMLHSDYRYASQAIESRVLATTQRSPATPIPTRLSAPSTHFVPSASSFVLLQLSFCHAPSPAHGYPYYNIFFRDCQVLRPRVNALRTRVNALRSGRKSCSRRESYGGGVWKWQDATMSTHRIVASRRKWRSFWRTSDPSRPRWDCPPTGKRNCKRATTVGVRGQTSHAQQWQGKGCAGTIPPR
jgi:hypothetical protein